MGNGPQSIFDRDLIPISRADGQDFVAVNLNYVLRTGQIPTHPTPEQDGWSKLLGKFSAPTPDKSFHTIDWHADDSFTRALKTIESNASSDIQKAPEMQKLLTKENWTKDDREHWEAKLGEIVTARTAEIPGLNQYRSIIRIVEGGKEVSSGKAVDKTLLNDLKSDIDNHTDKIRFDCQIESAIKGSMIQKLENQFLPQEAASHDPKDFKKAMSYFLVPGGVVDQYGGHRNEDGTLDVNGHEVIMTPAGNLIESTINARTVSTGIKSTYVRSLNADSTLQQASNGTPFYATTGRIYNREFDDFRRDPSAMTPAENTNFAVKTKLSTGLEIHDRSQLQALTNSGSITLTEAPKHDLIMLTSKTTFQSQAELNKAEKVQARGSEDGPRNHYEVEIFQRQMINTPLEGYVKVAEMQKNVDGNAGVSLSDTFHDIYNGSTFKLHAEFAGDKVTSTITQRAGSSIWGEEIYNPVVSSTSQMRSAIPSSPLSRGGKLATMKNLPLHEPTHNGKSSAPAVDTVKVAKQTINPVANLRAQPLLSHP